jgi:hypothetical protein
MAEFIVGVLLTVAAVTWVLLPVFRPQAVAPLAPGADVVDPDDDLSPHAVALGALREIEFDRATGKLSDADYATLHRKYTAEAVAAMRAEDAVPSRPGAKPAVAKPAAAAQPGRPAPVACPVHGPRPEPDAVFCSECGRRLGDVEAYCGRCGTSLEAGASYCHACGARSAA